MFSSVATDFGPSTISFPKFITQIFFVTFSVTNSLLRLEKFVC